MCCVCTVYCARSHALLHCDGVVCIGQSVNCATSDLRKLIHAQAHTHTHKQFPIELISIEQSGDNEKREMAK